MWEDPNFVDGGRFVIKTNKTHTNRFWEDLVIAYLGEQFQDEKEVLGLVISIKPSFD